MITLNSTFAITVTVMMTITTRPLSMTTEFYIAVCKENYDTQIDHTKTKLALHL
jgi:hypothetical protein